MNGCPCKSDLCMFMLAHMCMRTYTYAYVYLCLCAYVCADMCMYIHMHRSHLGSKRPAETVVRTIMRAAQQSNDNLGATPPSARQSHQRDTAPDSGVEPPAIEVVASPPCEITDAPSDVPAPDSALPQSAPHAPHPPPPLPAASSSGVEPPVAAPSMPSHIAFEETLVSLVLVGPAASTPQRTKTDSAESITKALRRASGGKQVV